MRLTGIAFRFCHGYWSSDADSNKAEHEKSEKLELHSDCKLDFDMGMFDDV